MKNLDSYSFKNLFIPDKVRKKSSFTSELWSLIILKILPTFNQYPDIRIILGKSKKKVLLDKLDEFIIHESEENKGEAQKLCRKIRSDAVEAFNDLANIINGELQNLYITDRLQLLNLDVCFLSGMPTERAQQQKIVEQLEKLLSVVVLLRESYKTKGVIIQLSYRIEKLYEDIILAKNILFLTNDETSVSDILKSLKNFVENHRTTERLRDFIRAKSQILVKTIVEHNSESGGKYIASKMKDYIKLLWAALLGGLLISVFALLKIKIEGFGLSILGEGLLFGLNYAVCFVLTDMFGGVIATKQPAMTANTLTKCVFNKPQMKSVKVQIADVISDVSKSQFISFIGNVLIAFFLSIGIAYAVDHYFSIELIEEEKASYLLKRNNILASGSIFYAAIAGIFLSLSGFISGYTDNALMYYRVENRIASRYKKATLLKRAILYFVKRAGKFTGSIVLGFFLGLSGAVGLFSGIPFDIRHVAFSTAHIGYASYSQISGWFSEQALLFFLSLMIIGFVNFFISFFLTLFIALKARNMRVKEIKEGFLHAFIRFIKRPWNFILPVRFELSMWQQNTDKSIE